MPSADERFRAKVERRDDHEVWTGSVDARGVGMVRIDGKLRTVQRAAWEFAYGPLPHGARVNSCAVERSCVRVDHLSLSATNRKATPPARRRPKGTGSVREVRPGFWKVTVTEGRTPGGRPVRRSTAIEGRRGDAEEALHALLAGVRRDLGDLRVGELVRRLLEHRMGDRDHVAGDLDILHNVLEPQVADALAVDFDVPDAERVLAAIYREMRAPTLPDARSSFSATHTDGRSARGGARTTH